MWGRFLAFRAAFSIVILVLLFSSYSFFHREAGVVV